MTEPSRHDGDRILVVDDEAGLRAAYTRILSATGFTVESCDSAVGVVERLREGARYLVIVTDLVMPGMDGIDLLQAVRALDAEVPVVILTGRPSVKSTLAAAAHRSCQYLVKPVTPLALSQTVKAAAARYRLSDLKRRALEDRASGAWLRDEGTLESRFESALSTLFMVYQPIMVTSGDATFGFEALVRTAEETLARPAELFAAAERLGRVQEVGRSIRARVSSALTSAPPDSLLFVNLHEAELTDPELYLAGSALSRHASRVVFEISERKSLDDVLDLRSRLVELRRLGYRIAVDDFGAGPADLDSFNALAPEIVKLEVSLIRDVDRTPPKRALVESMIRVFQQDLMIQVVCKGVETVGERDVLIDVGGALLQGDLLARPERQFSCPSEFEHSETRLAATRDLTRDHTVKFA